MSKKFVNHLVKAIRIRQCSCVLPGLSIPTTDILPNACGRNQFFLYHTDGRDGTNQSWQPLSTVIPPSAPLDILQAIKSPTLNHLAPSEIYSMIQPLLSLNPPILAAKELVLIMKAITFQIHPLTNPSNQTISNYLLTLFDLTKKYGFNPPTDAYTTLVMGLSYSHLHVSKLLDYVSQHPSLCSDAFYKAVLHALLENRQRAPASLLSNRVPQIWKAMKDNQIHPSNSTIVLCLKGFGRIEDSDGVNLVYYYIRKRKIIDEGVWNAIVEAYANVEFVQTATKMVDYMQSKLNLQVQR